MADQAMGEIIITRVFDAPRDVVWKYWTEPDYFMRWWGSKDFTAPFAEIDLRVGGRSFYAMQAPDGKKIYGVGTFKEVIPLERIVVTDSFADEEGNVVSAAHYGMDATWPLEALITVTFEDEDGKTKMTLRHSGLPETEETAMVETGWNESFDKLASALLKMAA